MTQLKIALLRTLAWFELFGYPLTAFECWQYLYDRGEGELGAASPWDVVRALEQLAAEGRVEQTVGYWRLHAARVSAPQRLAAARVAVAKHRRAQRGARLLAHLPYVRLVGLGNTLALGVARPTSDIDLLIVLKPGRMFLGRLLVTLLLHFFGWRRHGAYVANRLCLSFYLDTAHLNLQPLAYPDDPYLTYWVATMVPLLGGSAYREFLRQNRWVGERLPHWLGQRHQGAALPPTYESSGLAVAVEHAFEGVAGWWLEPLSRVLQLGRIRHHRHSRLGDGTTAVVVSGGVLKFHESDRRPELAQAWRQRLEGLGVAVV